MNEIISKIRNDLFKTILRGIERSPDHVVNDFLSVFQFMNLLGKGLVISSQIKETNPFSQDEIEEMMKEFPLKLINFINELVNVMGQKTEELHELLRELEEEGDFIVEIIDDLPENTVTN